MDLRHPPAEVHIDADLVRGLLASQYPDLADASLSLVGEGWDNVIYRAGPSHAVRLPRRAIAADLLRNEQAWLPVLGPKIPVAVPRIVFAGSPARTFRWPWSVVEWLPGVTADVEPLRDDQARVVADVLRALHRPAPPEAPVSPFRGMPLANRRATVEERLDAARMDGLWPIWRAALAAPPAQERRWLHGDLHAFNVLVADGALSGIIDWGDLTGGDVANDLGCAWVLFDSASARREFFDRYQASYPERLRAAGWAVNLASALSVCGDARHQEMGVAVARRLLEEAAGA